MPISVAASKKSLILLSFFFCLHTHANVIVDGREWLQPTSFRETWDNLNAACPLAECSGLVGIVDQVDVTGYRWASPSEVYDLFTSFIGTRDPANFDPLWGYREVGSSWAPAFLAVFEPTNTSGITAQVRGWMNELGTSSRGRTGIVFDVFSEEAQDRATVRNYASRYVGLGAWMYREVNSSPGTNIPAPATAILICLGLLGLCLSRKNLGQSSKRPSMLAFQQI